MVISQWTEEQGEKAAEYIVDKIGKDGGKVAIIQGIPGADKARQNSQGEKVFENTGDRLVLSAHWIGIPHTILLPTFYSQIGYKRNLLL